MKRRNDFNADSLTFRIRTEGDLKARYERIAKARGGDPTSVAREGLIQFAASEERRLGLVPTTPVKVPAAQPA